MLSGQYELFFILSVILKDAVWSRAVAHSWNDCPECAQGNKFEPQHNINTNIPSHSESKIKEKHSFQKVLT